MYDYNKIKPEIFKEENQQMFLEIRDKVYSLLKTAGAFKASYAFTSGDSWIMLACIDRLVELREITEIKTNSFGIDRIFIKGIY